MLRGLFDGLRLRGDYDLARIEGETVESPYGAKLVVRNGHASLIPESANIFTQRHKLTESVAHAKFGNVPNALEQYGLFVVNQKCKKLIHIHTDNLILITTPDSLAKSNLRPDKAIRGILYDLVKRDASIQSLVVDMNVLEVSITLEIQMAMVAYFPKSEFNSIEAHIQIRPTIYNQLIELHQRVVSLKSHQPVHSVLVHRVFTYHHPALPGLAVFEWNLHH